MASISTSTGSSYSGPNPGLSAQYGSEYQTALGLNQQNYAQILNQYLGLQQNTGAGTAGVAQGYGALGANVQQTIQGIGASQSQAIQDVYAQQSGQLGQGLVSKGLGNTTVSSQLQRGVTLDQQKAQIALANQMAQLQAGYQASLGGAGLQASLQGVGLQAQSGNTLLGALAGYKTPYPSWAPNSSTSRNQSQGTSGLGAGGGQGGIGGINPNSPFAPSNLWAAGQGAPGGVGNALQGSYGYDKNANPYAARGGTAGGTPQTGSGYNIFASGSGAYGNQPTPNVNYPNAPMTPTTQSAGYGGLTLNPQTGGYSAPAWATSPGAPDYSAPQVPWQDNSAPVSNYGSYGGSYSGYASSGSGSYSGYYG